MTRWLLVSPLNGPVTTDANIHKLNVLGSRVNNLLRDLDGIKIVILFNRIKSINI